jgi:alkylation response protein AidB-like acyl-CoA dehydrogenase
VARPGSARLHGGAGHLPIWGHDDRFLPHSEIVITDLRVHDDQMLGGRGQGHLLGQYRLGPARRAHCMRWIAQAETALDMVVDRSLNRFSHGSLRRATGNLPI